MQRVLYSLPVAVSTVQYEWSTYTSVCFVKYAQSIIIKKDVYCARMYQAHIVQYVKVKYVYYITCSRVSKRHSVQYMMCVTIYSTSLTCNYVRYSMYSIVCPARHRGKVRVVQSVLYTMSCKLQNLVYFRMVYYSVVYIQQVHYSIALQSISNQICIVHSHVVWRVQCTSMYHTVCLVNSMSSKQFVGSNNLYSALQQVGTNIVRIVQ